MLLFAALTVLSFSAFKPNISPSLSTGDLVLVEFGICLFALNCTIATLSLRHAIVIDGISLRVIFWFYAFVFMSVAPMIQAFPGIWRHEFDLTNLFSLSSAMLAAYIFFILGYSVVAKRYRAKITRRLLASDNPSSLRGDFSINGNRLFLVAIVAFIFSIIVTVIYGTHFTSSIIRAMFGNSYTPMESMSEFFVRPFLFFCFSFCLYAVIGGYKHSLLKPSLLLLSVSVFLIIGPLSGARAIIFFLYFGLAIMILRKAMIKHPILFGSLLFFGIFASELQNILRASLFGDSKKVLSGINYFYQGHFDGFEMLGHAVGYVEMDGIVFGSQLLGAILFWVPRAIWPEKPIGSGDFIANEYISTIFSVDFLNFSMPLIGEAYINFGFFGVCLIFYLVGAYCGKEDTRFHLINKYEAFTKVNYYSNSAPLRMWRYTTFLGIFLFILRGDLQSGISFLFGLYLALIFAWLILHSRPVSKTCYNEKF